MSSGNNAFKASVVLGSVIALAGTGSAQSLSTSSASNTWGFSIDRASLGSNLQVTDLGESTYYLDQYGNAIGSGSYTWQTAGGQAIVSPPTTSYNASQWMGSNAVVATAYSSVAGQAVASVGSDEMLDVANAGSKPILLDVNSSLFTASTVSTQTGFAGEKLYGGIQYGSQSFAWFQEVSAEYWGDTSSGQLLSRNGYALNGPFGHGFSESSNLSFTLNPGDQDFLVFYISTVNYVNQPALLPAPSSACTLAFGLGGFALMRRRRASSPPNAGG